jgi:formate hydrogenlyase subunit 4
MSSFAGAALQVGGAVAAPALPGLIQSGKARLQGRRGASALQPYRDLRRLWGKTVVDPEGSGPLYRAAPALTAACLLVALALVPVGGRAGGWGLGNDALVLAGLLALARFALTVSAWDPGDGFTLMGAARDLTLAVFGEALLVLALLVAALPAQTTDLVAMTTAAGGSSIWGEAAHWCGALAFALVVLVETGRQPVDNPDTHLELTMIHEGPLLEYAGRDLAYLHWAAAARHWIMFALAAGLFLPHPRGFGGALAAFAAALVLLCAALAVTETAQAKMRILRVPSMLAVGWVVALIGVGVGVAGGIG